MYVCVCVYIETTFFNNTTHESLARMANRTVAREPAGKSYAQCREMLVPPTPTLRRLIVTHVLVARRVHVLVARRQVRFLRHCGCVCAISPARCSSCKAGSGHSAAAVKTTAGTKLSQALNQNRYGYMRVCVCAYVRVCVNVCMCMCTYIETTFFNHNTSLARVANRAVSREPAGKSYAHRACLPGWLAGKRKT